MPAVGRDVLGHRDAAQGRGVADVAISKAFAQEAVTAWIHTVVALRRSRADGAIKPFC